MRLGKKQGLRGSRAEPQEVSLKDTSVLPPQITGSLLAFVLIF